MDEDSEETTTNISAFDVLSCIHSNNDLDENPLTELNNQQEHRSDNSYQMFDYSPPATDSSNSPENMRQLPPLTINMNPQYSYEPESAPPSFIHQTPPNSGYVDPNVCTPQSMTFEQTPSGHMAIQQQMMITTPVNSRGFEASRGPPGPSRRLYHPQQREHHHPYHLPRSINMPGTSTDDFAQFFPDLKTNLKQEMEERPPSIVQLPNSESGSVFDRNEERRLNFFYDKDTPCAPIYDEQRNEIPPLEVWVDDIKKVEWGHLENSHIVYKKNLFQFTTKILSNFTPKFVLSKKMILPIKEFRLDFHGVKKESPSTIIKMDQSNASRTNKSKPDFPRFQVTAGNTVALNVTRLHFSQATEENKKPPNPHQKYFIFVIKVMAVTENGEEVTVRRGLSEPLIVRAGNPDSFNKGKTAIMNSKQDMDDSWKENGDVVYTMKQVAIGTEIPEGMAALTVAGDVIQTGRTAGFSDANLKENQKRINTKDALENLMMLEPKTFDFKEEVAKQLGLTERSRAGFIAQEVQMILPDAVKRYGEFLTLDERRIFVEGIAATIELARAAEKMQDDINANAELIEKLMQRAEKRRTASIGSGLHKDDTLSLVSRSSSRRHLGIFCDSKVTMWTVLTAVICLMTVLAVFLGAMVFLYYIDLSHRYGGPDGIFPPLKPPHPPGAFVDPASLQQNLTALSPVCNGHCHSYCCSDLPERNISRITMTNMNRKPSKINPELSIFLPQLNETIDSRYCVGSCFQKERKYHLYVPISQFLPANPLLVQFRVPLGRMVNSCGYLSPFPFRTCDNNRVDVRKEKNLRQIDDVTFEIPVGRFLHSAFRFEVGFTRRTCSLLSFSDEKISNVDVDEFTLVFYRRCS